MEPALLREREVTPRSVDRDAEQLGPVALKLRQDLVVQHHLVAAHRTPIGRIERENHRSTAEVVERHRLVGSAVQREVGCRGPRYKRTGSRASDCVRHESAPFICRQASRVLDRPKPDNYVRDSSYQETHLLHKDACCVNTHAILLVPVFVLGMSCPPAALVAQDAFEIAVYGAETAPRKAWELEAHFNYIARGTTAFDGPVAPSERQFHLALELTRGLTDHWEVTAYLLSAYRPGPGVEYAGWRLRSRVRAPESWRLPVDVGLAAELEFSRPAYDETTAGLEIRPILGKRIGPVQLAFNPVIERALREGETSGGGEWEFEPSARVGVTLSRVVELNLEYFGKTGVLGSALPAGQQVHQIYPGVNLKLGDDFELNLGVGFGATSAGNRLVFKS